MVNKYKSLSLYLAHCLQKHTHCDFLLYYMQQKTNMSKVCAVYNPKLRKHMVTVEGDRLFHLETTQWQEIDDLILRTVEAADRIESEILERDDDARYF